MIIKPTVLRKKVKKETGFQISTDALYNLINATEEFIREKIAKSKELLMERNELRKIQGLPVKKRINSSLIGEVLKE